MYDLVVCVHRKCKSFLPFLVVCVCGWRLRDTGSTGRSTSPNTGFLSTALCFRFSEGLLSDGGAHYPLSLKVSLTPHLVPNHFPVIYTPLSLWCSSGDMIPRIRWAAAQPQTFPFSAYTHVIPHPPPLPSQRLVLFLISDICRQNTAAKKRYLHVVKGS